MNRKIKVVPYQRHWRVDFNRIKKRLLSTLDGSQVIIHHIGSTAVVGLPAKPILDIDIEINSVDQFNETKKRLGKLGYHHVGDQEIKGREVFKLTRWHMLPRHHLYVCVTGTSELKRHLAFKDYLNTHEDMKKAYGEIKIAAAKKHPYDMDAYLAMKGTLIQKTYQTLGLE